MKCSRCNEESTIKQGNQWLCDKHYRFGQMRQTARRSNKYVPSHSELESIDIGSMECKDCGVVMCWRAKEDQCKVASLQHYRSGEIAIVCRSCNTRHAYMNSDEYVDMPKDHKLCPSCGKIQPDHEFYSDNSRSGERKKKSHCRKCSYEEHARWIAGNKERYNQYQREWRAKRKAAMLEARNK